MENILMKLWIYGYSIHAYFGEFVTLFIFGIHIGLLLVIIFFLIPTWSLNSKENKVQFDTSIVKFVEKRINISTYKTQKFIERLSIFLDLGISNSQNILVVPNKENILDKNDEGLKVKL